MLSKLDFKNYLVTGLTIAIFTTPLGILTIKGWAGYHLFICALISLIILRTNQKYLIQLNLSDSNQVRIIAWVFTLPFLTALTGQLLRNEFDLPALDSPSRFLFAIPILYGLATTKINTGRLLIIAIPLSIIATYFLIPLLPQKGWAMEESRLATYSVDPITFGKISLGLGLMSALIAIENIKNKIILIIATVGFFLGTYLSIQSQSRTGWLSIFFVLLFLIIHIFRSSNSFTKKIIVSVVFSTALLTPFLFNPQVSIRVTQAIHEITEWHPNKTTANSSVGMRLSFWRIGSQLLIEKPITGWGNVGFRDRLASPDFTEIASEFTREFTLGAGFHSDIVQNAVRSGLGGLIAYLSIFLFPLFIFINFYRKTQSCQMVSGLGIIYVSVELISSLSTEVLSLKSTASFYGLMVAILIAGSLNVKTQSSQG